MDIGRCTRRVFVFQIAFQYGRDPRDVARWNKIRKPYTIFPKQKLRIIPVSSDRKSYKQATKTVTQTKYRTKKYSPAKNNKTRYVSNKNLKWQWPTSGKVP